MPLTGDRVFESFSRTAKSAGALDGWSLEELALLSRKAYHYVAILLNLVEEGNPWPTSCPHARVAYLLKEAAEIGQVMNYRPLTVTSSLYRCWATCRLEDMHLWVQMWSLDEMFAGVPGKGATDAWHEVLTSLEVAKLEDQGYCGGVADIAKFFDQIKRAMLYQVAAAAGMPIGVLTAYKA